MFYGREDMSFVHYRWELEEEPVAVVYQGRPSTREFDPFNGNQVLYIINQYGASSGELTAKQARIIESLIAHQLPEGPHTELSVLNWIGRVLTENN